MFKIKRHKTIQEVDIDGEIHTFCEVCGKNWGYYNTKLKWLNFKIRLHDLQIKIILF